MKTIATFLFSLLIISVNAQDSDTTATEKEAPLGVKLFQMHMPLILAADKVSEKVATDGHEGGMAFYIDVGDYKELASRRAFFVGGIQTYAMTGDQLAVLNVENFLRLDDITNYGATTEYNFFSHTNYEQEIGISATVLNATEKESGPQLNELIVLDMDEDFENEK